MQEEQKKVARESSELRKTISTLKQEMETATRCMAEYEEGALELNAEIERLTAWMKLERLRATAEEKDKWEVRESRLTWLLEQLQSQLEAGTRPPGPHPTVPGPHTTVLPTGPPTGVASGGTVYSRPVTPS